MDVFRESQRDLTDAKDRGLITDDVFNRAIADKFRDLTQSGGIEREFQLPSAMEFGSAAAASTIANQRSGPSVVSLLEAIANSSSENAKLADGILRQLAAADQSVPVLLPR
jgi:hypothetical protein